MEGGARGGNDDLHGGDGNDLIAGDALRDLGDKADTAGGFGGDDLVVGDSLTAGKDAKADTAAKAGDDRMHGDAARNLFDKSTGGADVLFGDNVIDGETPGGETPGGATPGKTPGDKVRSGDDVVTGDAGKDMVDAEAATIRSSPTRPGSRTPSPSAACCAISWARRSATAVSTPAKRASLPGWSPSSATAGTTPSPAMPAATC